MTRRWIVAIILLMAGSHAILAQGTIYYIRDGGTASTTGTGACVSTGSGDWNTANACDDLPATLVRGATYYFADGTYATSKNLTTASSGTNRITLIKATESDHGTNTGWQTTYGDGYWTENTTPVNGGGATIGNVQIQNNYWTIDGNTNIVGRYGFSVNAATFSTGASFWVRRISGVAPSNMIFADITMDHSSAFCVDDGSCNFAYRFEASSVTATNMEIWNTQQDAVTVKDCGGGCILEYLYIHGRLGGLGVHGDAIYISEEDNGTGIIRYSRINWSGQQMWFGGSSSAPAHGCWTAHGNIFYGGETSGQAIKSQSSGGYPIDCLYLYNNTIANMGTASISISGAVAAGESRNNIFYDVPNPGFFGRPHDYNWFKTGMSTQSEANAQTGSDPFVNEPGNNYHLTAATNAGDTTIGAAYNTDMDGCSRGADSVWDRGAMEYNATQCTQGGGGGGANPVVTITTPTSGDTYETTSSTLSTFAGTATDDGTVTQVAWINNQGNSGNATLNLPNWSQSNIGLTMNVVNTITATATDNSAATHQDTLLVMPVSVPGTPLDSFARPNWSTLGPNWTAQTSLIARIESQQVEATSTARHCAFWNAHAFSNDQYSQIRIRSTMGGVAFGYASVRAAGTSNTTYDHYHLTVEDTVVRIAEVVDGTRTVINSYTGLTINVGDTFKLEAQGTSLRTYHNTTLLGTETDATLTSGAAGVCVYGDGIIDDFQAGDIGGPTPPTGKYRIRIRR